MKAADEKPEKQGKRENFSQPADRVTGVQRKDKDFGLTVRIEINLPAQGDKETYDRIFQSIRDNLLNG